MGLALTTTDLCILGDTEAEVRESIPLSQIDDIRMDGSAKMVIVLKKIEGKLLRQRKAVFVSILDKSKIRAFLQEASNSIRFAHNKKVEETSH